MSTRRKVRLTIVGICLLLVVAALVDLPQGPDLRLGTWWREIKVHLGLDLKGGSRLVYDADVSKVPDGDRGTALEGVRDVIERRVNLFGVSEPLVQTTQSGGKSRILVELAGIQDVNEAIKKIGETPLLEFQELKSPDPLGAEEMTTAESFNQQQRQKAEAVLKKALAPKADFAELAQASSEDPGAKETGGDIDFQRRENLDEAYGKAIFDDLKVGEISQSLVESAFGYHVIRKTDEREIDDGGQKVKEVRSSHILFRTENLHPENAQAQYASTGLTGQHLKRAQVTFNQNTGVPEVLLSFNEEGKTLFADITKRNLQKPVAILLDNAIISDPVVQTAIDTGEATINGNFTVREAKQLVQRLNAGALPVPITLVNQQTVGPTLGKLSIEKSLFAGLVGLIAVGLFMVVLYRFLGVVALLSLFSYTTLTLAIFKLWPVTLTLAGIAGFILSIGMAVDANILIYERIREELRAGRVLNDAIDVGFRRAWLSIRDSNVSSLITTFILAWFGTGIIKGFAITLAIGIVVSMFTALTIPRNLLHLVPSRWLARHPRWLNVPSVAD